MNGRDPIAKETRDEAARWYARLNNTTVTTDCLREFRAWKQINDTDGRMRQWELVARPGGKVTSRLVREFRFDTQAEGCVADDETGALSSPKRISASGAWAPSPSRARPGS